MKKIYMMVLALVLSSAGVSVVAAEFDGKKPLLCASMEIMECVAGAECQRVTAEAIDAPNFLRVDLKKKQITVKRPNGRQQNSKIKSVAKQDEKLILQGVEDGRKELRDGLGWTVAIAEDSGKMVLTASGDEVAFVIFGACTPL